MKQNQQRLKFLSLALVAALSCNATLFASEDSFTNTSKEEQRKKVLEEFEKNSVKQLQKITNDLEVYYRTSENLEQLLTELYKNNKDQHMPNSHKTQLEQEIKKFIDKIEEYEKKTKDLSDKNTHESVIEFQKLSSDINDLEQNIYTQQQKLDKLYESFKIKNTEEIQDLIKKQENDLKELKFQLMEDEDYPQDQGNESDSMSENLAPGGGSSSGSANSPGGSSNGEASNGSSSGSSSSPAPGGGSSGGGSPGNSGGSDTESPGSSGSSSGSSSSPAPGNSSTHPNGNGNSSSSGSANSPGGSSNGETSSGSSSDNSNNGGGNSSTPSPQSPSTQPNNHSTTPQSTQET
ncbi:hypothetical protein F1B92_03520, partial [Campylobacter sp. FMV-PI01]